jgi:hypothetical protein
MSTRRFGQGSPGGLRSRGRGLTKIIKTRNILTWNLFLTEADEQLAGCTTTPFMIGATGIARF